MRTKNEEKKHTVGPNDAVVVWAMWRCHWCLSRRCWGLSVIAGAYRCSDLWLWVGGITVVAVYIVAVNL
jgi:hypothetical protein